MDKSKAFSAKREIMDAFMKLMAEKVYMEITVTDIIKKAGVARASFYRNFNSINDVIDAIVEELFDDLLENILPTLSGTNERKMREFLFNYFYQFLRRKKEMEEIRFENLPILFSRLDNKVEKKEALLSSETIKNKYSTVGKMGLINSITRKWMESGAKEAPEEMIDYIMSFITLF